MIDTWIHISIVNKWSDDLIKKLNQIDFEEAINFWIRRVILYLYWEIIIVAPVDTWLLRNSHRIELSYLHWEIINTREYWYYVHEWTIYQKSQPWITNTVQSKILDILDIFQESADSVIQKLQNNL